MLDLKTATLDELLDDLVSEARCLESAEHCMTTATRNGDWHFAERRMLNADEQINAIREELRTRALNPRTKPGGVG